MIKHFCDLCFKALDENNVKHVRLKKDNKLDFKDHQQEMYYNNLPEQEIEICQACCDLLFNTHGIKRIITID